MKVKSPESVFVLSVLALALLACAATTLYLDFEPGPSMWGGLFGVGLAMISVVVSFFHLRRSLDAPNLSFLKSFILSMMLRLSILLLGGVLVWKGSDWNPRVFLILLGLSYPLLLALEALAFWRMTGSKIR